jgi:hypothetical protein
MAGILIMTDWKAPKHTMAWWDNLYTTLVQAAKDADDTPGVSVIDDSFDERPIPFTGEMVRAILDGRKSQTRRVVNPQPFEDGNGDCLVRHPDGRPLAWPERAYDGVMPCPYGQPGDRLWVRETWAHDCSHCDDPRCGNPDHVWYAASEAHPEQFAGSASWRPSSRMPRWASRITLEITEVWVERVQEISEDDANAEGCGLGCTVKSEQFGRYMSAGQYAFAELWDSINAKPKPMRQDGAITHYVSFPWSGKSGTFKHMGKPHCVYANPWVWCIGFRKLERAG